MSLTAEECEKSDTKIGISKQQLATEKYRSAGHWFWSGLRRYPTLFLISVIFSVFS